MGKLMKFKKPKGNKALQITKSEINEYNRALQTAENNLKLEMIEKMALLCTAFSMEESYINKDPKKIVEMYEKLNEWAGHINDHTISINAVVDIINEAAGTELIHWEKK